MAHEIAMPRQGQSVESCLILEWRVRIGDVVKATDVVCEVETDKASFEVEAGADGTILAILHEKGADVPVLAPIAYIGNPGEAVPTAAAGKPTAPPVPAASSTEAPAPRPAASRAGGRVFASPRARLAARERSIRLEGIAGTGPGGRILEKDVMAAAEARPAVPEVPGGASASAGIGATGAGFEDLPVLGVRKVIAERMAASLRTHAQLSMHASADARRLQEYRARFQASGEDLGGITINDMVMFAVARTLPRFPELNAHFLGASIRRFSAVNLGFAVDTPRGLLVPVIRSAASLSLVELSSEARRLAQACIAGKATPADISGGTFSVSNLGALGIEAFTPVLATPEIGILGVCAILPRPVTEADEVRFVPMMGLSLTFDHQAVDGAPAARFLQALSRAIADFDLTLAG